MDPARRRSHYELRTFVSRGSSSLRLYYFAVFAALGAYAPFFPRWLEARGIEGIAMGAVSALVPALGVLGPPAVGLLADALGLRGSLLRVACAGACLSLAGLGITSAAGASLSFGVVFAAVFFYAAFRSPMVMLADVVALEHAPAAGTTYGRIRLWGSMGFLAAVLVTGRILGARGPAVLPLTVSALLFIAFLSAWTLPQRPGTRRLPVVPEARALLASRDFSAFLAVSLLAQSAHVAYDLCFSLHLRDLGASSDLVGISWAVGVVFEVALMAFAERILARFAAPSLLAFAIFGATLRWALIARVGSITVLLVLQPLHAISFALWWVASLAYLKARAPAHALATAQGLFSASSAIGSVVGMLAWGALYRHSGGSTVFTVAALVGLVAVTIALVWSRAARRASIRLRS
ncbi:Putative 3-phenylpropionic acid transporter [Minicystis rosea]|nr:Putative 3-phenylpropionic acid transporter [Minicystis rosea]